jgi:hypothetical protein
MLAGEVSTVMVSTLGEPAGPAALCSHGSGLMGLVDVQAGTCTPFLNKAIDDDGRVEGSVKVSVRGLLVVPSGALITRRPPRLL